MVLDWEGKFRLDTRKKFTCEGGENMEQVALSSGCPMSWCALGQVEWSFEQPSLVWGVPDYGSGLNWVIFKGLFWLKPFCDYVIISVWCGAKICICLLARANIYTVL